MKIIDNKTNKLGEDFKEELKELNIKMQVCASMFSMYAFDALKKELTNIDELNFIFSSPSFINKEKANKEVKEYMLTMNNLEKFVSGSEFEVKLKNKLNGRAIAKECSKWINNKVKFKSNINNKSVMDFTNIQTNNTTSTYLGFDQFNTVGLGYEKGNDLFKIVTKIENDYENSKSYIDAFNQLWNDNDNFKDITDEVVEFIQNLYKENSPNFIYYFALYNIFSEFLEDISEDNLPNDKTKFKESKVWNMLYDFQKDAVVGIINKIEKHNGCILADSVGLGKTLTSLAVIKYYQERNKSILVLCPKKLGDNWNTYRSNYNDNILRDDKFNYTVLFHTDLSREKGDSNGIDLSRINWSNFDLVVIDESHNFRNNSARKDRETRYDKLMKTVMTDGVNTKVLMLSATPVNNKFTDLKNQIAFAYKGKTNLIYSDISETKSIDTILRNAQATFNEWSKLEPEFRTSASLLSRLNENFDFFKLLDSVTIARSRKHIEKYYDMSAIGKFPKRLKPLSISSDITDLENLPSIKDIAETLMTLNMSVYSPLNYIMDNKVQKYEELYDTLVKDGKSSFKQKDRETSLKILMRINMLKRLESSVEAFRITLDKVANQIQQSINDINNFIQNGNNGLVEALNVNVDNSDDNDEEVVEDVFTIGNKIKIDLNDMNIYGWKEDLQHDYEILTIIKNEMEDITITHDSKLQDLLHLITNKINNPINSNNKKVIVFTAFADTAKYIYKSISLQLKKEFNVETALLTGSGTNECTLSINKEFNNLLINFSPISKNRDILKCKDPKEIDILIATDCISEGQNLQDCDYLINYDIHWNPVRIIQRFGRVDRIGSKNDEIQLVNFWPNMNLDDYIQLKNRVESRMFIADFAGTGEDNPLTNKSIEMDYRKNQLKKLQEEVVDLEEMNSGISITDLGLNEFRMDLLEYISNNKDIAKKPNGLHSVVNSSDIEGLEKGVIFILKNINERINIDNKNQLHPFYLVYIKEDEELVSNHLNVKTTLDLLRMIGKKYNEPIVSAYTEFNEKTDDGKKMQQYSDLLNKAVDKIINVKEESDLESLFTSGGTSMSNTTITGVEDFELITFLVVI